MSFDFAMKATLSKYSKLVAKSVKSIVKKSLKKKTPNMPFHVYTMALLFLLTIFSVVSFGCVYVWKQEKVVFYESCFDVKVKAHL